MSIGSFIDSLSWATASPEERAQMLANKKAELEYGDLLSSRGAQAKLIGGADPQSGITWNPTQPPTGNYQQADDTGQFQTMPVSGASPETQNLLRPAYQGMADDQNLLKAQAFPGAAAAQMQQAAFPSPPKVGFAPKGSQPIDERTGKPIGPQIPDAPDDSEIVKNIKALATMAPDDPGRPKLEAWVDANTTLKQREAVAGINEKNSSTDKNRATAKNLEGAGFAPEDFKTMAEQMLTGDTSPMQQMGYGNVGAANRAQLRKAVNAMAAERGMGGADIAAMNAEYFGIKSGERTLGTRTANIDMAVNEASQMSDLALEAADKVPRGKWVPVNAAMNAWNSNTGDPNTRAFGAANNSFINAYATAVGKGTMTVDGVQHARELLSTADGPAAYKAIVAQLKKEMAAAKSSPGLVRSDMRGAITSPATQAPVAAPATTVPFATDANGRTVHLINGKWQ